MTLQRTTCINLGGLDRVWIAQQSKVGECISIAANGRATVILDRGMFEEVELDSGSYQEVLGEDDGGTVFQSSISMQVRKDRFEVFAFERAWHNRQITAVAKSYNGDFLLFRNLQLSRQRNSGEFSQDFNGHRFQLLGNDWEAANHALAVEAIFWFDTNFNGTGRFSPAITFSGLATWNFPNGTTLSGNTIDTDGIDQGLTGITQAITIDSETPATTLTELYFRNQSIVGVLRLDLLPNLSKGDFALNAIESVRVGEWVNQLGVVIELRDNHLSTAAQAQFVQEIASRFKGTSSDLKIGLWNQTDAQGSPQPPDTATMELALQLYNDYGIEIHLPIVQGSIQIGHD